MAANPSPTDDSVRALYQGPLGEFTGARNALAKRLAKEGDARAGEVKELKKPSPSAWAVNQLFAQASRDVATLVEAGETARAAQTKAHAKGDGSAVRAALATIQETSARLATRAGELLTAADGAPSATVAERIATDLE